MAVPSGISTASRVVAVESRTADGNRRRGAGAVGELADVQDAADHRTLHRGRRAPPAGRCGRTPRALRLSARFPADGRGAGPGRLAAQRSGPVETDPSVDTRASSAVP